MTLTAYCPLRPLCKNVRVGYFIHSSVNRNESTFNSYDLIFLYEFLIKLTLSVVNLQL